AGWIYALGHDPQQLVVRHDTHGDASALTLVGDHEHAVAEGMHRPHRRQDRRRRRRGGNPLVADLAYGHVPLTGRLRPALRGSRALRSVRRTTRAERRWR